MLMESMFPVWLIQVDGEKTSNFHQKTMSSTIQLMALYVGLMQQH